ncbi:hypothetical protein NXS98_16040 [Fontisphaera persica]|uniref:anti-sigma factor family protein n=1 Tax=Fontisphaera persica TaxID=2974023 RepID=UPI0024C02BF5|nr:hypothetical protein [Fontisphaera persica]WCJ59208.1 hypothetical protein NXS98_16040 [Fontisphaera persica]
MKDYQAQLKVQAYLDGELPDTEARQVEAWLAQDAELRGLLSELRATRDALRDNEPEVKLPVPHALYWSGIERAIAQAEAARPQPQPTAAQRWLAWLQRYLAPAAAVAAVALLAIGVGRFLADNPARHYVEIINYSTDVHVSSFRVPSEKMFVVWLSPNDSPASAPAPAAEEMDWEEFYQ